jgi:hypothetical protein
MVHYRVLRATLVAGVTLFAAAFAQASTVDYVFNGTADSGSLIGESYSGSFSFDDTGLLLTGSESAALQSLSLRFLATDFDLASSASATADFQDGVFLGLSYTVDAFDPSFSLVSGLADTADAYFAYTPAVGAAGFGSVSYSVVPVPAGLALLPGGWAVLAGFRRRTRAV